jgi:hypothetical protein
MRARPQPRNWVSGELAPWLDGMPGELTHAGALTLENFIVKKQGGIQRRPGSFYVAEVKNTLSQTILIQCEIDSSHIYVLEMGNAYCRFYKNHVQVSLAAAAYEVVTPYSTADLTDLRWTYIPNEKALYFAHHNYALRKLEWTSDNSWAMSTVEIVAAPGVYALYATGHYAFTEDLTNWIRKQVNITPVATPVPNYFRITFGKNNILIHDSQNNKILSSSDGENWVSTGPTAITGGWDLEGSEDGTIVSCDQIGNGNVWISNNDGVSWFSLGITTYSTAVYSVGYDSAKKSWRVGSTNKSAYSQDIRTWISIADITGEQTQLRTQGYNDLWVSSGYAGSTASGLIMVATSLSEPWTIALAVTGDYFKNLCRGTPNGIPLWVASTVTNGWVYTSSNGLTWVRTATIAAAINSIEWAHSKYIAINSSLLYSSYDGITWTTTSPDALLVNRAVNDIVIANHNDFEWFDAASHYPKCIAYHEGRLIIGPTDSKPATLWGSKTNVLKNFFLGKFSNQAFSYDLASDRNVAIQWMLGGTELAIGTRSAEGVLRGSPEEGITPQTARMQWQSSFGSDNIQPIRIHDTIIFTQRGGEIVRGYVPGAGQDAWKSPDLTAFADHIAKGGINDIDHQDDPQTVAHFVRADGYGLGLTFEGNTRAWWRTKMGSTAAGMGLIESMAVIPTQGAEDEVWAIVKWVVAGNTHRYIVYFDSYNFASKEAYHGLDCGYYNSAAASATVFAACVPHLYGTEETVDACINGNIVEKHLTIAPNGTVVIQATNATSVHIGLPYTSYAQTMRIDQNSAWGSGAGLPKRHSNLNVWVHNTIGGKFGPTSLVTEAVPYTSTTQLTTDCLSVNFPGQWDKDGYIWCIQDDPLPMTVIAVAPDMEMGDR